MHKFSFAHREKLYEEKLRQQKEELKQLHEERQRLTEIQGKIQDLHWACPDLQVRIELVLSKFLHFLDLCTSKKIFFDNY